MFESEKKYNQHQAGELKLKMSNATTLKIINPKKHNTDNTTMKHDRCVACGLIKNLRKHDDGFWYCAECLEDEEKLDAIVEYYTDFSNDKERDPIYEKKQFENIIIHAQKGEI